MDTINLEEIAKNICLNMGLSAEAIRVENDSMIFKVGSLSAEHLKEFETAYTSITDAIESAPFQLTIDNFVIEGKTDANDGSGDTETVSAKEAEFFAVYYRYPFTHLLDWQADCKTVAEAQEYIQKHKSNPPAGILGLTGTEQMKISELLCHYFPWLENDNEDVEGSEVISELQNLYDGLF
jgi:hypothetical protein